MALTLQGYESKLYLERNSTFAFYYYLQHDKRFSEISELDVEQLYVNQLVETVQRDYPEQFYFAFSHGASSNKDKIENAITAIEAIGYKATEYLSEYNAVLLYFEYCDDY